MTAMWIVFALTAIALTVNDASFHLCRECKRAFGVFGARIPGSGRRCWKCWRIGRRWPRARLGR